MELVHGARHDIIAGGRAVASDALLADMDDGLVIARTETQASGVCSTGFGSCMALLFRRPDVVGLEHTSRVDLESVIEEALAEFESEVTAGDGQATQEASHAIEDEAQPPGQETELSIGYSTAGYRSDLEMEIDSLGLKEFWSGRSETLNDAEQAQALTSKEASVRIVLQHHVRDIEAAARQFGASTFDMPHGMLYVPIEGDVELFAGSPKEPDIQPARD